MIIVMNIIIITIIIISPWNGVLLENLTDPKLVKKFMYFIEQKVHCLLHKSLPPVRILSQFNPVYSPHPSHFLKIYFNFILLSIPGSSKWSPSLWSPKQNPGRTSPPPPIYVHTPVYLILPDLITRIVFGEQYRP